MVEKSGKTEKNEENKNTENNIKRDVIEIKNNQKQNVLNKKSFAEYLRMGLIAFFSLILIVAIWSLYASFNDLISLWINYKFAPVYRAILNVGVIVVVFYILRKMVDISKK